MSLSIVSLLVSVKDKNSVDHLESIFSNETFEQPSEGWEIPVSATRLTQNMYYLKEKKRHQPLDAYIILHFDGNNTLYDDENDTAIEKKTLAARCYGYHANGARWKNTKSYTVDPTNRSGMSSAFITDTFQRAVDTWNSRLLRSPIFGEQQNDGITSDAYDINRPDGLNFVRFGKINQDGVIAVTVVWGSFNGNPSSRQIVEWDQLYDDYHYTWGDASNNPSIMDFQNIATHELGHALGLSDQYDRKCSSTTMYGYSKNGEFNKRYLSKADEIGECSLYERCQWVVDVLETTSSACSRRCSPYFPLLGLITCFLYSLKFH